MDNLSMIAEEGSPKENIFRRFAADVSAFGWPIALRLLFGLTVTADEILAYKDRREAKIGA